MFARTVSALAAACVLGAASPAGAALIVAQSSGVLTGDNGADVYDATGVFGTPGLLLNGLDYTLTTTYDTTGATFAGGATGSYLSWSGGILADSALTVNGVTHTIQATAGFLLLELPPGWGARLYNYITRDPGGEGRVFNMAVMNDTASMPADVLTNGSGNLCIGATYCGGTFNFNVDGGAYLLSNFTATNYTYTIGEGALPPRDPADPNDPNLPPIPEPSTWALLILGFGGTGAMLRRRSAYVVRPLR